MCHITTTHRTGDHRIFYKECATLAEAGYDVTLIAPHPRRERIDGIEVIPLPDGVQHPVLRMAKRPLAAYRLARDLDADIYHFHDPDFLPYAALLARRGKPVIYDAHEDVAKQILAKHWIRPVLRRPIARSVGRIEELAVRRLSMVICANPPVEGRFRAIADRVEVVGNFPRLAEITPAPWESKTRTLCYAGGISRVRGIVELVDAMASIDAELLLAGAPSPSSLIPELEQRPGWARVRYLGWLGRDEVGQMLDRSRVGALPLHAVPNHLVSYPVKLFEYMAAGIPVVATDVEPWAPVIKEHECGICVPVGDPAALAAAITRLLDDPAQAQAMGERGRRAAEQSFSWESEAAKLLQIYAGLLA